MTLPTVPPLIWHTAFYFNTQLQSATQCNSFKIITYYSCTCVYFVCVCVFIYTLHAEGMYPYHVQRVQHLGPGDFAERLEFCKWFTGSRELHRYILFTDESQFNHDGVNNTHNSHMWADENPHATVVSNFQQRFSVNMWCAVLDDPDWSFHLGRLSYRRGVPQISAGGIAPTYGGCAFK